MFYLIAKAASSGVENGEDQLVTCGGLDCSVCKIIEMVVRIWNWMTWTSFAVAVLFAVIGGFIYIGSRGNEAWMSLAKRAIFWAVGGFAIVLLSYMAINTSVQVMGGGKGNPWDRFECNSDGSAELNSLPEKMATELVNIAKTGGELSGKMSKANGVNELLQAANQLDPNDMLIIEAEVNKSKKILAVIGKGENKEPKLFYVDGAAINQLLKKDEGASLLLAQANAQESNAQESEKSGSIDELITAVSQTIAKIIARNQNLVIIVTEKPGNNDLSANALIKNISKANQCLDSNGSWFRFSEICQAEQENCSAPKCTLSGNFNPVTGCNCPPDKCLSGGQCVAKSK